MTRRITSPPPERPTGHDAALSMIQEAARSGATHLDLSGMKLTFVPARIEQLTNLKYLDLSHNSLVSLPAEIWQLSHLNFLSVYLNNLRSLPPDIGKLVNLRCLDLWGNELNCLPDEIANLLQLDILSISNNPLNTFPRAVLRMKCLQSLHMESCNLAALPVQVRHLTQLKFLWLIDNQLTQIPEEVGELINLKELRLEGNPLISPPPEIAEQGAEAILPYLRDMLMAKRKQRKQDRPQPRYEAKLVLVGLGAAGKTCLVNNLYGRSPIAKQKSTRGIEVTPLPPMLHPTLPGVSITLNAWDFAGQEIEHSTHRFFLTRRSLYLVLWNPREGNEQEGVEYWLRTIALHAPGSRVLLVATYADDRIASRLDVEGLKRMFAPDNERGEHLEICGLHHIGNLQQQGIDDLKDAIAQEATQVAGMGELWTPNALRAEAELLDRPAHDLSSDQYAAICGKHEISRQDALGYRGKYWYELGKILYFPDDPHIKNMVVLKPDWISKAVSRIMNDPVVTASRGILHHNRLEAIWNCIDEQGYGPYTPSYYDTFLRLMYRFELSYELPQNTPSEAQNTLVPHLLPVSPPQDAPQPPADGTPCVRMIYRFGFLPAGLMSRFIVRTHRHAHGSDHWRTGVVLEYEGHLARVELGRDFGQDICTMTVWGIYPHNFFVMLKGTMDDILRDYKGIQVKREIPCLTQNCSGVFEYEDLENIAREEGEEEKERCGKCRAKTSIRELLYGIAARSAPDVAQQYKDILAQLSTMGTSMSHVEEQNEELLRRAEQQSQQLVRFFTALWEQHEAYCPTTFLLMPTEGVRFKIKALAKQAFTMS